MKRSPHWGFAAVLLPVACASRGLPAQPVEARKTATSAHIQAPTTASSEEVVVDASLASCFAAEGVEGGFVVLANDVLTCSDADRCSRPYLPASTFKIANTLIALEVGVVESADTALPWDGRTYSVPAWNQDHTLASAMAVSCVPCFQAVAEQIGPERMQQWLTTLRYGNQRSSGGVEGRFWLEQGDLRITPREQVEFMRRLDTGALPVSERSQQIAISVIPTTKLSTSTLRAKTGAVQTPPTGWLVGWLEGNPKTYFATLIDGTAGGGDFRQARLPVSLCGLSRVTGLALSPQSPPGE